MSRKLTHQRSSPKSRVTELILSNRACSDECVFCKKTEFCRRCVSSEMPRAGSDHPGHFLLIWSHRVFKCYRDDGARKFDQSDCIELVQRSGPPQLMICSSRRRLGTCEVDAFDSHERGVDKTTFDSMKQGKVIVSDPCTVELKAQMSVP